MECFLQQIEVLSISFSSEEEFRTAFHGDGGKVADAAFKCPSEQKLQFEELYPEHLEIEYVRSVPGLRQTDLNHESLLASDGWR